MAENDFWMFKTLKYSLSQWMPVVGLFCVLFSGLAFGEDKVFFDPTRPFFESENKKSIVKSALVLQAIYVKGDRKQAVINGLLLDEGDLIQGAIIKKIVKDKVYYQMDKKQKVLMLHPTVLRKVKGGLSS